MGRRRDEGERCQASNRARKSDYVLTACYEAVQMACNIVLKMNWEDQGDVLKGRASSGRATDGCISQESQGVTPVVGRCSVV